MEHILQHWKLAHRDFKGIGITNRRCLRHRHGKVYIRWT